MDGLTDEVLVWGRHAMGEMGLIILCPESATIPIPPRCDAYHDSQGRNFGTAVSCDSAQAPTTDNPGTHLRHPYPRKAMTSEEIMNSPPRRNVLFLDGHVEKVHITIYDIRRPEMEKRGLFE